MSGQEGHLHRQEDFSAAFAIGISLNIGFVLVEAFYGWKIDSLALLADAGHNLTDVAGLVLAWAAAWAGRLRPDARHTYGWRKASILAAFVNSIVLLVAMGSLAWEAFGRLQMPQPTEGVTIIQVAAIGIAVNTATALLFMRGRHGDLNIRGAFLHMVADALVSLGVVVGGALYVWGGWPWIDPALGLGVALIIVVGTWRLFRQSLHLLFDGVPDGIDLDEVKTFLLGLPADLAAWYEHAGRGLHERFAIVHPTLQIEIAGDSGRTCGMPAAGC
jgi:cobalt-zinc-cadmium efflux system protein